MRWGGAGSGSRTPRAVERHARRGDRRVAEQCKCRAVQYCALEVGRFLLITHQTSPDPFYPCSACVAVALSRPPVLSCCNALKRVQVPQSIVILRTYSA